MWRKVPTSGSIKSSPVIRLTFILLAFLKLSTLVWVLSHGWRLQISVYKVDNYEFKMQDVEHGIVGISEWLLNSRVQHNFHPDYNKYWNQVKDHVVICIKTGKEVQDTRVKAAKNSWMEGRDIPHLIVVSDVEREVWPNHYSVDLRKATLSEIFDKDKPVNGSNPMENLLAGGWEGDKDKNLPAFLLMHKECPRCKVFFLVDDDTYVLLENLAWNLLNRRGGELYKMYKRSYRTPVYSGRIFRISSCYIYDDDGKDSNDSLSPIFAHGGAGIIMNNKALENMLPHIPECVSEFGPTCYAGDMQVALCVSRYGGIPDGATRVEEFQGDHLSWMVTELDKNNHTRLHSLWNSTQRIVTLHQLPEPEQVLMHEFEMTLVGNQTFRDLKHFAWKNKISRRPKRMYVKLVDGNQSRMITREVMS